MNCSQVFQQAITGRRLAIADSCMVALVPRYAGVGDEIWAIPGMPALFALKRGSDGTHELIGEAYVHGAMTDVVALAKAGKTFSGRLEDITLK
jgi:hypothetical protein